MGLSDRRAVILLELLLYSVDETLSFEGDTCLASIRILGGRNLLHLICESTWNPLNTIIFLFNLLYYLSEA